MPPYIDRDLNHMERKIRADVWGHIWKLNFRIRAYRVKLSFQM
jgi:hypothetical protein